MIIEDNMSDKKYKKEIAHLESINDQLQAEFNHLDKLLRQIGFDEGIATLKEAAKEMLETKELEEE